MLVDLNTLIKPRLYVMDGIMAMEGNGPRSGKLRPLNVLLFSTDPVALDATACRIIGLEPEIVPTSLPGEKAGLGTYHSENIELPGDPLESFITPDFDVERSPVESITANRLLSMLKNRVTPRPVIDRSICTACGTCVSMCPVEPKAVNWRDNDKTAPPVHNYGRCIRCYCCQEMCPEGAISVKNPLLAKLLVRI
jgi:ferredoxin